MQINRYVCVKQVAGYSKERVMKARKKELLDRMSRCVRVWVALAKSAAPAEQGDKQGDKQGDRKGEEGGALEKVAGTT
jgi:hypothetical protein